MKISVIFLLSLLLLGCSKELDGVNNGNNNVVVGDNMTKIISLNTPGTLCDYILEGMLFSIEPLTMKELVKVTKISHVTIKNIINSINKKYPIIIINENNKPYRYSMDIDMLYQMTNKY